MEKSYVVKGKMRQRFEWVRFEKLIAAPNELMARDRALSVLGGNHKLKRFQIKIESVQEEPVNAE
ncbi:MAG: 50S ribosomal protein L18Ae [Candidatus Verstraetearchaeota archaeon]|nr:50S ribosomal protein L18Ae [Candidatus Verstraetearchaeota archaeon]